MSEITLTPKLRFPGFSGDWEKSRIGEIYKDLRAGSTPSRAINEYFKGNNLWIITDPILEHVPISIICSVSIQVTFNNTF